MVADPRVVDFANPDKLFDAQLVWLDSNLLEIDPEYQRRLRINWVDDFVKNWRPESVGVLLVNLRADGRYIVIDGQHRLSAMRRRGERKRVPCLLFHHRDTEWEAQSFPDFNRDRSNLTPMEVITAEQRANTKLYTQLCDAVRAAGFEWGVATKEDRLRVNCPALLTQIAKDGSPDDVRDILLIISEAWHDDEHGRGSLKEVVEGVWLFYRRYRDLIDRERLVSKLRQVAPETLIRDGESMQRTSKGSVGVQIARQIVDRYNRQLKNRLPAWGRGKIVKGGE
jgi:hypothetical protein